ncbi:MAG: hypothetical protein FWF13_04840, partial [Acidobacteria bacterium]|nr:hypothetical protein [Acidobacteriota bacterium]
MQKKTILISACLTVALIGIVIFSVMYDFRSVIDIFDHQTPLSDLDSSIDFYDENFEQIKADRVLNEIIIKFVDPADVLPREEKQLQNEINKVKKIGFVEEVGAFVVRIDDLEKNPNAVLNRFKNNRFIEYIEP